MAGNSFQFPVTAEPPAGEIHFTSPVTLVNTVDPANTNDNTVTDSGVPAGTKGVYLFIVFTPANVGNLKVLNIKDSAANIYFTVGPPAIAADLVRGNGSVKLDANKQFIYNIGHTDIDDVCIYRVGYYL